VIDIWEAIVKIRAAVKSVEELPKSIAIRFRSQAEIAIDENWEDADLKILIKTDSTEAINPLQDFLFDIKVSKNAQLRNIDLEQLRFYLPFTLCGFFGRKYQKCYAISHFAQTLDGKIATNVGDSKWIGNKENLIHAHKMRALCDGILVGSRTLERDNPKLNVRRVTGIDPVKIILGGNGQLGAKKYHAIEASSLVFKGSKGPSETFDCVVMPKNSPFDLHDVLKILAEKGIYSVYIEGGSYTTSCFLNQKALDQVQIHFSSKILGSGVSSFDFGNIQEIKDAITFQSVRFVPKGNEMMFVGNL
jgi:diaminohydroxyphosphoribosylaminopyrimidine deaminase/5-amino-6-(5-phosphoribosylamino)uracil reductase